MPSKKKSSGKKGSAKKLQKRDPEAKTDTSSSSKVDEKGALGHYDVSRSEAAVGREALKALREMKVLIVGLRGSGIETAKNVVLLGVQSCTVWDQTPPSLSDLGCNFYLKEKHTEAKVGRAQACHSELQGLNPFCSVHVANITVDTLISKSNLLKYTNVVVTDIMGLSKSQLLAMSQICHDNKIYFSMALTSGVTCSLFSDFGPNHMINDPDGVPTVSCIMEKLELVELKENLLEGCVRVPVVNDEGLQRGWVADGNTIVLLTVTSERTKEVNGNQVPAHGLEYDRTPVKLEDLRGELSVLNGADDVYVTRVYRHKNVTSNGKTSKKEEQVFNQLALDYSKANHKGKPVVVETKMFQDYKTGGVVNELKPKSFLAFKSLAQALDDPSSDKHEFTKFLGPQHGNQGRWESGAGKTCHIAWLAALDYREKHDRYPRLHNEEDANEFIQVAEESLKKMPEGDMGPFIEKLDTAMLKKFSLLFPTELTGFAAFLGGAVAQEVVKSSGKFSPIHQWLHIDDPFLLSSHMSDCVCTVPSRYAHQISIFGEAWQEKVKNSKVFLVGCGALGCEYIKGMALMGVGCGTHGHVTVTDMDTIEPSNLTRQFLFRSQHVGKGKSEIGAEVVKSINKDINVTALTERIAPETEGFFTHDFWEDKDLIWNALDNVHARAYADVKCLWHNKPLLESGTMGTSCNSEIYLPYKTQSYRDGADEQSGAIPMCTVRNFPHLPVHAIEWAKIRFNELYVEGIANYQMALENKGMFLDIVDKAGSAEEQLAVLEPVKRLFDVQNSGKFDFGACINLAIDDFNGQFRNRIADLVFTYPEHMVKSNGEPFWSGHRRFPKAINLDLNDPNSTGMRFVFASANLFASAFGLAPPYLTGDLAEEYKHFCDLVKQLKIKIAPYKPKTLKLSAKETGDEESKDEEKKGGDDKENEVSALKQYFNGETTKGLMEGKATKFEKDDDNNHHIDFMTAATNLRSDNYVIPNSTRPAVRVTAGRIIPALVTTTAMITGLNELEYCKLMMGLEYVNQEAFMNWNIALGVSNFNSFNPNPANRHTDYTDAEGDEHVAVPKGWTNWHKLEVDEGDMTGEQLTTILKQRYHVDTEFIACGGQTLWNKQSKGTATLAQRCAALTQAGGSTSGTRQIARVVKELMALKKCQSEGFTLDTLEDEFHIRATIQGPALSFYEGGTFVMDITLPDNYPTGSPSVTFRTKIYHCNVDGAGKPCPDQIGLGGRWSASSNLRGLINNTITMLQEQDPESALIPARGKEFTNSPAVFGKTAKQWTRDYATAAQTYTDEAKSLEPADVKEVVGDINTIKENYLIFVGHFSDDKGRIADLPLIKYTFRSAAPIPAFGTPTTAAATAISTTASASESKMDVDALSLPIVPVDDATAALVMAMTIASEEEESLQVVSCYKLQPERASLYLSVLDSPGFTWYNGIAVTCTTGDGDDVEMIVHPALKGKDLVCVPLKEDQISMSQLSVTQMVEYQFDLGGRWLVAGCGSETAEYYKSGKFAEYSKLIKTVPPPCMASLRRLLQNGPVNRMFDPMLFTTPSYDQHNWQVALEKNGAITITNIPHQVSALRVWNSTNRGYDYIDPVLTGAPSTEESLTQWFTDLVIYLKSNLHQEGSGAADPNLCVMYSETLDSLVTEDGFRNKWTDLVLSIQPPFNK